MKTLDISSRTTPIPVPREVAVCPICEADIEVEEVMEWECESGEPMSIQVQCTTEPDIDGDEWWGWQRGHWSMPYVDWLPVENRVLEWFRQNFRCE
jgi:hypothetical protein